MTWPWPPQRGQMELVTIWPRKLWRTRCTWPAPAHSRQVIGCVPGLAPGGLAGLAGDRGAHRHRVARAEHRLLEGEVGDHLEVLPARRARGPATAATAEGAAAAEEGVEDVVDPAAAAEAERVAAEPLGAEAVVALPLLGVGQHLVGDGDLLEALLGRGIGVGVGVELPGQAAVGALDVVGAWRRAAPRAGRSSRRPSVSRRSGAARAGG